MKRTIAIIRANAREFDRLNGKGVALREALGFLAMLPLFAGLALGFLIMMGE
jgi:hypothetical protein